MSLLPFTRASQPPSARGWQHGEDSPCVLSPHTPLTSQHQLTTRRQHFQKIRKEANGGNSSPTRNVGPKGPKTNGSGSAKSTPRKPKSMTDSFPTSNGSFSNGNSSFAVSDGQGYEDDEEEMMTPLKRKRMMKDESLENDGRSALLFKKDPHQGGKESPIQLEEDE